MLLRNFMFVMEKKTNNIYKSKCPSCFAVFC